MSLEDQGEGGIKFMAQFPIGVSLEDPKEVNSKVVLWMAQNLTEIILGDRWKWTLWKAQDPGEVCLVGPPEVDLEYQGSEELGDIEAL